MNVTAIKKGFIFQFVDHVNSKGEFEKGMSSGGVILKSSSDDSAKYPRWVNVTSAGADCNQITTGCQVLLPALRWTEAAKVSDVRVWKSDETQGAAMRTTPTGDLQPLTSYVLFKHNKPSIQQQNSGLLVVIGNSDNTPNGDVISIGPDVLPELANSRIYFNGANFFETFTHNGAEYSFIKEEDVLVFEPK